MFVLHRRVVVILDMEILKSADQMPGKIGDPTPYVEGERVHLTHVKLNGNFFLIFFFCSYKADIPDSPAN